MSIERTYYCDGPECERHARTGAATRVPVGFLRITGDGAPEHFCSWDCVLRHAAKKEPAEMLSAGPPGND